MEYDHDGRSKHVFFQRPRLDPEDPHCRDNSNTKPSKKPPRNVLRTASHTWTLQLILGCAANLPWRALSTLPSARRTVDEGPPLEFPATSHSTNCTLALPRPRCAFASLNASTDTHEHHSIGILRTALLAASHHLPAPDCRTSVGVSFMRHETLNFDIKIDYMGCCVAAVPRCTPGAQVGAAHRGALSPCRRERESCARQRSIPPCTTF